eukprot:3662216-Prorocentrum_lima.AAC.1
MCIRDSDRTEHAVPTIGRALRSRGRPSTPPAEGTRRGTMKEVDALSDQHCLVRGFTNIASNARRFLC